MKASFIASEGPVITGSKVLRTSPSNSGQEQVTVPFSLSPVVMPGRSDCWEMRGNVLIRHHRSLRTQTFSPSNVRGIPCDMSDLQSVRKTLVMDERKRVIKVKIDDWAQGSSKLHHEAWIGETRFYFK